MKLKISIAIILIILMAIGVLYLRGNLPGTAKTNSNNLSFYEDHFEMGTLSLSVRVKTVNQNTVTLNSPNSQTFDVPLASDFKILAEKTVNNGFEATTVDSNQITAKTYRMTLLSIKKDSQGVFRAITLNLFE